MTEFPPDTRANQHPSDASRGVSGRAFEHHFTPKEIAKLWNKDEDTIRRIFRNEPGVLCVESTNRRKGTRRYVSLSIPASVLARVHQRLEVPEVGAIKTRIRTKQLAQEVAHKSSTASGTVRGSDELWEHQIRSTAAKLRKRTLSNTSNRAPDP